MRNHQVLWGWGEKEFQPSLKVLLPRDRQQPFSRPELSLPVQIQSPFKQQALSRAVQPSWKSGNKRYTPNQAGASHQLSVQIELMVHFSQEGQISTLASESSQARLETLSQLIGVQSPPIKLCLSGNPGIRMGWYGWGWDKSKEFLPEENILGKNCRDR